MHPIKNVPQLLGAACKGITDPDEREMKCREALENHHETLGPADRERIRDASAQLKRLVFEPHDHLFLRVFEEFVDTATREEKGKSVVRVPARANPEDRVESRRTRTRKSVTIIVDSDADDHEEGAGVAHGLRTRNSSAFVSRTAGDKLLEMATRGEEVTPERSKSSDAAAIYPRTKYGLRLTYPAQWSAYIVVRNGPGRCKECEKVDHDCYPSKSARTSCLWCRVVSNKCTLAESDEFSYEVELEEATAHLERQMLALSMAVGESDST